VQAQVGILEWGSKFFGIKLNDSALTSELLKERKRQRGEPDEQGPTTEKPSEEASKKMNIFERRAKADSIVPECAGMGTSATFPLLLQSPGPN